LLFHNATLWQILLFGIGNLKKKVYILYPLEARDSIKLDISYPPCDFRWIGNGYILMA